MRIRSLSPAIGVEIGAIDLARVDGGRAGDAEKSPPGGPGFDAEHPVAVAHPITGEKVLYLSRNASTDIVGFGAEESAGLMQDLFSYIEAPATVYRHKWLVGDTIIWDNLALVPARTAFDPDAARAPERLTVSGAPGASGDQNALRSPSEGRRE